MRMAVHQSFFRPSGAGLLKFWFDPRLAPWAVLYRRFAAGVRASDGKRDKQ